MAVFNSPLEAEVALRNLKEAGFGPESLSVAGRESEADGDIACYYHTQDGVRYWGRTGQFWNSVWGTLVGWAFLNIPGIGPVLVAGRLADWVVTGLENAAIFRGLTALGAALYSIGIPKDAIAGYQKALASGRYLVVAHGPAGEVARATRLLRATNMGAGR